MKPAILALLTQAALAIVIRDSQDPPLLFGRDESTGDFPWPANKSSVVDASTEPKDSPPQDLSVDINKPIIFDKISRRFAELCKNEADNDKIVDAWDGAAKLAAAQARYRMGYRYDIPHSQWLGPDWNSEGSWIPWKWNFRKVIERNFGRLLNLFGDNADTEAYILWYCNDYADACTDTTMAYSWDKVSLDHSWHYTVFCPLFFQRRSLASAIEEHRNDEHKQRIMENFQTNRDLVMFHEIWHYQELVSLPRTGDYAYQAQGCWDLAKEKGTNYAYVNADSYALDAMAIYVQQTYSSDMSPIPYKEYAKLRPSLADIAAPPSDPATYKSFDSTPPGWHGPPIPSNVADLKGWKQLDRHPPPSDPGSGTSSGQQIAVASYTNPLGDPAAWNRLISYNSDKLSILVANVLNGPDYVVNDAWAAVIQRAAASGKTIIGYVRTGYLGVSAQRFKTRLGSSDLADWASQIEQDVDKWFELYPSIGGIFFDEGWPECGANNVYSDLYAYINAYTKRKHPGAYTVLNPGSPMAQCFEDTMDTLLTFESYYDYYINSYTPNDWVPKDPRKLWHIIYRVPQDKIAEVISLAKSRHAGYVEVTDDDGPNPYDNVPADSYMQSAISAVSGGKVRIDSAPSTGGRYATGLPFSPTVQALDYTSVTITWTPVQEARGYAVYQDNALVLELPATLTRATVGMLQPGQSGIVFEVRTLTMSDSNGTPITMTINTKSLPSSGSITNVQYTRNGDTVTYTADVLVPFAFVRLFIGGAQGGTPQKGWPIDLTTYDSNGGKYRYKILNYLVEGNDFYSAFFKYTGSFQEQSKNPADWTWTPLGTAPQSQSGYTYTWTVPFAGTDAVMDQYVVQGQGYAPLQNIYGGTVRVLGKYGDIHNA